jgi:hypothetical protein
MRSLFLEVMPIRMAQDLVPIRRCCRVCIDWAIADRVSLVLVYFAAGRKKRRARMEGDMSDSSSGVPPEQNQAQIIQYMPNNNGDFSETFLRSMANMMTGPNDMDSSAFENAFDGLQLGQVCFLSFLTSFDISTVYSATRNGVPPTACRALFMGEYSCGFLHVAAAVCNRWVFCLLPLFPRPFPLAFSSCPCSIPRSAALERC